MPVTIPSPHHPSPPMNPTARPCTDVQTVLGEGVRWDDRHDELLSVDIIAGTLFRYRVEPTTTTLTEVSRHASAVHWERLRP